MRLLLLVTIFAITGGGCLPKADSNRENQKRLQDSDDVYGRLHTVEVNYHLGVTVPMTWWIRTFRYQDSPLSMGG